MRKVIIVGGGAAGLFAALFARKAGAEVTLVEKNDRLGKKMLITGKGRCNITNTADLPEFIAAFGKNGRFLNSAIHAFTNTDCMEFFESIGVPVKTERGGRLFPVSDKAQDVVLALEGELQKSGVRIILQSPVSKIDFKGDSFEVRIIGKTLKADAVIIAVGGATYPGTGSTGDGYEFAQSLGHSIIPLRPSLVPVETVETWPKEVMGLSLKNVELTAFADGKKVASEFGEMLFTHFGISGPLVLSISKKLTNIEGKKITFTINLKPALSQEKLDARLLRDFEKYNNKDIKNGLDELLPQKLIPIVIQEAGLLPEKKVHSLTREERLHLVRTLQGLTLTMQSFRPLSEAIITAGGVKLSEVSPKTMESKLVPGLYFAGEILDVDALTGGYNLQAAFSTGLVAGKSSAE